MFEGAVARNLFILLTGDRRAESSSTTMDTTKQSELIHQILYPDNDDAHGILEDLQLAGLPSPDLVHQEIERKLLLPRETLPNHWLPSYQVCDGV